MRPTGLAPHWCVAGGGLTAGHWAAEGRPATGHPAGGTTQPRRGHHAGTQQKIPWPGGGGRQGVLRQSSRRGAQGLEAGLGPGRGHEHSRMAVSLEVPLDIPTTQASAFDWLHCLAGDTCHRLCSPARRREEPGPLFPVGSILDLPSTCGVDSTTDVTQTRPGVSCLGLRGGNQETTLERPRTSLPRTLAWAPSVCPSSAYL